MPLSTRRILSAALQRRPHRSARRGCQVWRPAVAVLLLALLATGPLLLPDRAQAQDAAPDAGATVSQGLISMNFQNVELLNFVTVMSRVLELPMVWEERTIKGNITLVSPKRFSRQDARRIFETVLNLHGFTTLQVPGSPVIQIVEAKDAARLPAPTRQGEDSPVDEGAYLTQIIPLRYADANQVKAALQGLMAKTAALAVYDAGNVLIVSDQATNIQRVLDIVKEIDVPKDDLDFQVVRLKHASAKTLEPILSTLVPSVQALSDPGSASTAKTNTRRRTTTSSSGSPGLKVVADDRTNSLILVGDPISLKTFRDLIEELDVPGSAADSGIRVFPLEHAAAKRLEPIVSALLPAAAKAAEDAPEPDPKARRVTPAQAAASGPKVVADERTNSLILVGDLQAQAVLASLLDVLDVPGITEASDIRVYRLKYASAKKLEPLLSQLVSSVQAAATAGGETPRGRASEAAAAASSTIKLVADERTNALILLGDSLAQKTFESLIAELDGPGQRDDTGIKVYRLQFADAEALATTLKEVDVSGGTARQQQAQKEGTVVTPAKITFDKATNSLVLFGSPDDIARLDEMVAALDVRRPQVYVEALIMEVTLEKSLQLGVTWQATTPAGNDAVIGSGQPTAAPQTLTQALAAGTGAAFGIVGNEIEFQGQNFVSFSGFIQATRQDQDIEVLANPQVLTLNNQEAEINVSQVVPVSAKVVTNAQQQTTTEFEFKDVGVILRITPQITGTDKVKLLINQESSSIAARQTQISQNQQAITTLKRIINTQVLVDNGTTVAIGGLIQDQQVATVTKVPCLGDIPVLGWFFRSRAEELRKTNLIVFIRPSIVNTEQELRDVSDRARSRYDSSTGVRSDTDGILRGAFELPSKPKKETTEQDATEGEPSGSGESAPAQQ